MSWLGHVLLRKGNDDRIVLVIRDDGYHVADESVECYDILILLCPLKTEGGSVIRLSKEYVHNRYRVYL